jgi:uncharacterized protein YoxC
VTVAVYIAAISFALLAIAGVAALVVATRFMSESTRLVSRLRVRGDVLFDRVQVTVDGAQAAVDRANRQLDQTETVTASMEELGTGMAELAGQVTALAGFGKAVAASPVGRVAALAYGIRHAVGRRRARTLPGSVIKREAIDAGSRR